MKTLAVLSRKGGTGKTTVALHLAAAARAAGQTVLVADVDRQHSALEWRKLRIGEGPAVEAVKPGALFTRQQEAAREGVSLLIVDTGPSVEEEVEQAVRCADLCLVVARPNFFDLRAVAESAALAARFHRPTLFVINQAPPRRGGFEAPIVGQAVRALKALGAPVAGIGLRARVAYQHGVAAGLTAQELEPDGAAAHEIAALWRCVEAAVWPAEPAVDRVRPAPVPLFQPAPGT
ncbi:MAG: AAA family ATPase [Pseudomonadota bacterium]